MENMMKKAKEKICFIDKISNFIKTKNKNWKLTYGILLSVLILFFGTVTFSFPFIKSKTDAEKNTTLATPHAVLAQVIAATPGRSRQNTSKMQSIILMISSPSPITCIPNSNSASV